MGFKKERGGLKMLRVKEATIQFSSYLFTFNVSIYCKAC